MTLCVKIECLKLLLQLELERSFYFIPKKVQGTHSAIHVIQAHYLFTKMSELNNILTNSIKKLFPRKLKPDKPSQTCEMCLKLLLNSSSSTFNLSEKTMKVLLNSVLLAPLKINCCSLILCEECSTAVAKLSDLFAQMETLSNQFNELRRRVGKQLISTALNLPHTNLNDWEKQVRDVEHIVPSCLNRSGNLHRNGNTILQADNSINSPNEIAGEEDRAYLIQVIYLFKSSIVLNSIIYNTSSSYVRRLPLLRSAKILIISHLKRFQKLNQMII